MIHCCQQPSYCQSHLCLPVSLHVYAFERKRVEIDVHTNIFREECNEKGRNSSSSWMINNSRSSCWRKKNKKKKGKPRSCYVRMKGNIQANKVLFKCSIIFLLRPNIRTGENTQQSQVKEFLKTNDVCRFFGWISCFIHFVKYIEVVARIWTCCSAECCNIASPPQKKDIKQHTYFVVNDVHITGNPKQKKQTCLAFLTTRKKLRWTWLKKKNPVRELLTRPDFIIPINSVLLLYIQNAISSSLLCFYVTMCVFLFFVFSGERERRGIKILGNQFE